MGETRATNRVESRNTSSHGERGGRIKKRTMTANSATNIEIARTNTWKNDDCWGVIGLWICIEDFSWKPS
jgi:hypothetical protein